MSERGTDSLAAGALDQKSVLAQSLTHVGPALGFIFGLQIITGFAGPAAPLAFAAALVVMLLLAVGVTQLARHLPSAGGYITYVSHTVSPQAGLLTAWLSVLYEPLVAGFNLALLGAVLEATLGAEYGITVPWWSIVLVGAAILAVLGFRGIRLSMRAALIMLTFEVVLCLALAVAGLLNPGAGGVNLSPFDPGSAPAIEGLYLGVIFAIFGYAGFESVAPLAEESRDPRRTLPRAMIGSLLIAGLFLIVGSWGVLVGWGTADAAGYAAAEAPVFELAHRLFGDAWVLLLVAMANAVLAVSLAAQNASTRMLFALGRNGVLPRALGRVDQRRRTPSAALALQTAITLVVALGGGALMGPFDLVVFVALTLTLAVILVYSLGNLGVWRLYRREHRHEFRWLAHAVCPGLSTLALLWVGFKSVSPLPPEPGRYAPLLVAGWLAAGIVVVLLSSSRGRASGIARLTPAGDIS